MKRVICLLLAGMMLVLLAACGDDNGGATATQAATETTATEALTQPQTETEAPTEEDQPGNREKLSAFISEFDREAEIEESVIYEKDGISITAKSLNYDPVSGPQLKLSVKNETENDILIQSAYVAVNGFMMRPDMNIEVPAGKTAAGDMTFAYYQLAMADINTIADVRLSLRIMDKREYEVITVTEPVDLTTTAAEGYEPSFDEEGQVVYDKKKIKIVIKGVSEERLFSDDPVMMVYLYNGTDQNITVQTEDVLVNGYEFTSAMSTTLLPGKRAVDIVTFFSQDMEEYGVETIESVKVSFEIKDEETWENIDKTDMIDVKLGEEE